MVITTQAGRVFLAGSNISCCIRTDPTAKPTYPTRHSSSPLPQTIENIKKYYSRTDNPAHVLDCAQGTLGKYDTLDRAKAVAADFKEAVRNGAQTFTFPER